MPAIPVRPEHIAAWKRQHLPFTLYKFLCSVGVGVVILSACVLVWPPARATGCFYTPWSGRVLLPETCRSNDRTTAYIVGSLGLLLCGITLAGWRAAYTQELTDAQMNEIRAKLGNQGHL